LAFPKIKKPPQEAISFSKVSERSVFVKNFIDLNMMRRLAASLPWPGFVPVFFLKKFEGSEVAIGESRLLVPKIR
jgi:hypothetical protein